MIVVYFLAVDPIVGLLNQLRRHRENGAIEDVIFLHKF
jgi:hypothetical protein